MLIKIKSDRYAPWGLYNDQGDLIIWLADSKKTVEIKEECLNDTQINTIKRDIKNNILFVENASFLDTIISAPVIEELLPLFPVFETSKKNEDIYIDKNKINEILNGKVKDVLKNLEKAREDKSLTLNFFNALKNTEKAGKNRKTILEQIIEISIEKLAEIKTSGIIINQYSNTSWLSSQYENLIELTYEDKENIEEDEEEKKDEVDIEEEK